MKLFTRSGGCWIFWTTVVYFIIGMVDLFLLDEDLYPTAQIIWLMVMWAPLVIKPLARWLNMKTLWEE